MPQSTRKPPMPRIGRYLGHPVNPWTFDDGSWIEGEELAYDQPGFPRRAYCRIEKDGPMRVVRCGLPDTYFSIPARLREGGKTVKGYLAVKDSGVVFYKLVFQGK